MFCRKCGFEVTDDANFCEKCGAKVGSDELEKTTDPNGEISTKSDITELVFILDRSGSMSGMESDTIGGFNSMLEKQQKEAGECRITTVLFDDKYEILHDRADIREVSPITEREYFVGGTTALLDAIGRTINKIGGDQKEAAEGCRAEKVLFVITTDGMENASREFDYAKIKSMVEHQKSNYGWEFIFLGANIDAVEVAEHFGVDANRAQNFHNDSAGIAINFAAVSNAASLFRMARKGVRLPDAWSAEIEKDYKKRTGA